MNRKLSLLLIEDSEDDAALVLYELRRGGYDVSYRRVQTANELTTALKEQAWDIAISDYSMPSFSAPEALKLVQDSKVDIPFIIVSGTVGEDAAVHAMKAGAHDFFPKGKLARLVPVVERELRDAQERRSRYRTERQLFQSEDRFAKIFQASPIGISISTLENGEFIDVNTRFSEILGYHVEELIGNSLFAPDLWEYPAEIDILRAKLTASTSVQNEEIRFLTKTGETYYCLASFERISLDEKVCVLAMIVDITERKLAEDAVSQNSENIKLLQEVSVAANEASDVNVALQFAIDRVCAYTGWDIGHAYLMIKSEPLQFKSAVWNDYSERFAPFYKVSEELSAGENGLGLIAHMDDTELYRSSTDIANDLSPLRAPAAEACGIKIVHLFPVRSHHEIVAILEFFSTELDEPSSALMATIAHIATQVGHVIERAQANAELNELYNATSYLFNAENLQDLAEQIVNGIVTEFDQVDCGLLLIDKQQNPLIRAARAGNHDVNPSTPLTTTGLGLVPKAIRQEKMIYAPDVNKESDYAANVPSTRSELIVPLKTPKGILGVLDLQSPDVNHFSRSDRRILSAFAERAASAIEIMQLIEEINQHANQLELRVAERTAELIRAKERAEAILNNSSDAIILADSQGAIRQTNLRFNNQFGYDSAEMVGRSLPEIIGAENAETLAQAMQSSIRDRQYVRLEVVAYRKDGSSFPADAAISSFADNDGIGIACSLRDISEQKNLEHELREAFERQKELADLKTRFVSIISHEYRTPLATILSSSSLLRDYSDRLTDEKKLAHLDRIQTQIMRLTELLDQVLEINRAETAGFELRRETIDLVAFCKQIVADIQQIDGTHQLEFTQRGEPVPISGDVQLLRQIISNLLSNAIKYSPQASTVKIALAYMADQVILTVSDKGIGIPKDDIPALFTAYHRAANVGQIQGTGLGLAIIKHAVEAHGGTVSVDSTLDQGTTFTVQLPL